MFNQIFNFHTKEVRMVVKDNQPWFAGKDVCEVLEIVDHKQALNGLDDDEYGGYSIPTIKGLRKIVCVNESGLYHLIFKSRKKVAKDFRKWVTSEVLPSIRKDGFYMNSGRPEENELRHFIERFFPKAIYGIMSERTGYRKLIPVSPHFRSCKIARININNQLDFFKN